MPLTKNIADFLPYYIGQDCMVESYKGKLQSIGSEEIDFMCVVSGTNQDEESGFFGEDEDYDVKAERIKPILRPLSSMTDAEIVGLFKTVSLFDLSECSFNVVNVPNERWANAESNGRVIDSIKIIGDNVEMMNNDGSFSAINPVSTVFHYLLKQGFDMFGLIEANLAVDKTKEVTNATN